MATATNFPFDKTINPTWDQVLNSSVAGYPGQIYRTVLETTKIDSDIAIQPWQIVTNVGSVWSNTVDTYMRVSWPAIVSVLAGGMGTGDFVGPPGSTPNGLVVFDDDTGKRGRDSTVLLLAPGVMIFPSTGRIQLDTGSYLTGNSSLTGPVIGHKTSDHTIPVANFISGTLANSSNTNLFISKVDPSGVIPAVGGALCVVTTGVTSKLYINQNLALGVGGWVNVAATAGAGDFSGPGSSLPDALVVFNGPSGKLGKDSVVTLSDAGLMVFPATGGIQLASAAKLSGLAGLVGPIVGHSANVQTVAGLTITSGTAPGGTFRIFPATSTPVGSITGNPGDLVSLASGTGSLLFLHTGASANNTSWTQIPLVAGVTTLAGLTDVTITVPTAGEVLGYNAGLTKWVKMKYPSEYILSVPGTVKTGTDLAFHVHAWGTKFTPTRVYVSLKTVDSGNTTVQVRVNGVTDVLTSALTLTAGNSTGVSTSITPGLNLTTNDLLTVNITAGTTWNEMSVHVQGFIYAEAA